MKAETNAEVMGVVLDSLGLIKSEQCVDIMVLANSGRRKIVHAYLLCACSVVSRASTATIKITL